MSSFKTNGNEAMARHDYGAAIDHYTRGIEALSKAGADASEVASTLHILYSNRAQAYINTKKHFAEAIADCTKAIELNATFPKSYLRRATASARAGNVDAAAADVATLKGTPASAVAAAGLDASMIEELAEEVKKLRELAKLQEETLSESVLGERWLAAWLADPAHPRRFKLPSGVACEIIKAGVGQSSPAAQTSCSVHYAGSLRDGTEFDSSIARNEPAEFAPNQVIAGWTEVLQYMTEGDKWEILIPYDKAYGKRGAPPQIPGYATLKFSIELLNIVDPPIRAKPAADGRALLQHALGAKSLAHVLPL